MTDNSNASKKFIRDLSYDAFLKNASLNFSINYIDKSRHLQFEKDNLQRLLNMLRTSGKRLFCKKFSVSSRDISMKIPN